MDISHLGRRTIMRWCPLWFVLLAAACMHWAGASAPYGHELPAQESHRVRAYLADESEILLDSARVEGDSLIGLARATGGNQTGAFQRVSIPVSGIQRLEIREVNVGATVLLAAAGAAIVTAAILAATYEPGPRPTDSIQTCPLAYSWDGQTWRLDSGTFGGVIMAPLAGPRVDVLAHLQPVGGVARVRVASELNETDMIDAVELLVVDHPAGTTVAPDFEDSVLGLRAPVPGRRARRPGTGRPRPRLGP